MDFFPYTRPKLLGDLKLKLIARLDSCQPASAPQSEELSLALAHLNSFREFFPRDFLQPILGHTTFKSIQENLQSPLLQHLPLNWKTFLDSKNNGFLSKNLLYAFMTELKASSLKVEDSELQNYLGLFQKRFEVFGRIFDRYQAGLRKCDDAFGDLDQYALLAISLSLSHNLRKNESFLSTSLKLNDVLVQLFAEISSINTMVLIIISCALECHLVRKFYESRGFSLSLD